MTVLGVAVAIPAPWDEVLLEHRESFGDPHARDIPPHVTLLPPTEVADGDRPAFAAHLAAVAAAAAPFEMRLQGTGTFRPVSPVVFVRVAQGVADCERLEAAIRSGPVSRPLDFPYHPHVTVAHHVPEVALDQALDTLAGFGATFSVDRVSLYEHGADGVWRPAAAYPLG